MPTTEPETEPCRICGTPQKMRESFSPVHQQTFRYPEEECTVCAADEARANAARQRAILTPGYIRESGIPDRWTGASLDAAIWPGLVVDGGNGPAIEALRGWVAGSASLYLHGGTGSGKTTLAMAALLDCCRDCQEGLFLPEKQLEADLHRGWARDIIHRAWEVPVLVLDDIASRDLDARLMTVYRDIFDEREMAGRKTLVTGQKPPAKLMAHWRLAAGAGKEDAGIREDVASRLRVLLGGNAVEVRGGNRRLEARNVQR